MTIVRGYIVPSIQARTGTTNPPLITTTSLPPAEVGALYSFQMSAVSGVPPYSWSISASSPDTTVGITPSGLIQWTPQAIAAPSETVNIRVTDSVNAPTAPTQFQLTVYPQLQITTTSLPNATVGLTYSATLAATGGLPPYTWGITGQDVHGFPTLNTSTGALNTAPVAAENLTIVATVTDSLGIAVSKTFPLSVVTSGVQPAGPANIYAGMVDSSTAVAMVTCTPGGSDTGYIFYLDGVPQQTVSAPSPIKGPFINAGGKAQGVFVARGLTASSTHTISATAVVNGAETLQSASITPTTLAGPTSGSGSTPTPLPTAALDPNTWIVLPPAPGALKSVPTGNTLWIITHTDTTPGSVSANPGGGSTVTGCGLLYALNPTNGLNLNGGDVFAIQPVPVGNTVYPVTNLTIPTFTGTNGFTHFVSTQAPEYAGVAGTLPAYSYATSCRYTSFALSGAPAAAATSATLAAAFTGRTGYYMGKFTPSTAAPNLSETRYVFVQNGSTSVVWAPGLVNAPTSATLQIRLGNYPTPYDANLPSAINAGAGFGNASPSMPVIQPTFGSGGAGVLMNTGTSKVRFTGIAFQNVPNSTAKFVSVISHPDNTLAPMDSIYMDRCIMTGGDTNLFLSGTSNQMSYLVRGTNNNCNHALYHQCFMYGFVDGSPNGSPGGQDTQCIAIAGGTAVAVRNCLIEGQNEGIITAGQKIPLGVVIADVVRCYNDIHKPTQWQTIAIGREVKNALEYKFINRGHDFGNLIQNNWFGLQSQGQQGRGNVLTSRDQTAAWELGSGNVGPCTITGISGTTISYTAASQLLFGGQQIAIIGATGVPNFFFTMVIGSSGGAAPNFTLQSDRAIPGVWGGGGMLVPSINTAQGPWVNITNVDIHDNVYYDQGGCFYVGGCSDDDAAGYTSRIRFANNQLFLNPGTDNTGGVTPPYGIQISAASQEVIVDHNTVIINNANGHFQNGNTFTSGIAVILKSALGADTLSVNDRVTVTNNLLDGKNALFSIPASNAVGLAAVDASFSNTTWTNNAAVLDAQTFAGTPTGGNVVANHHAAVTYTGMGFANWTTGNVSPTQAPVKPGDWNVVSGTMATASSSGGPIGAQFDTLAQDQFPRLRVQCIAPAGGGGYNNQTFWTQAGMFNIVDVGNYMGQGGGQSIEQFMGMSWPTIFQNIKTAGAANGIVTRCGHYTNSANASATATSSSPGSQLNAGTYYQWTATLNSVNWWLRAAPPGYPTGTIVIDSFGASDGSVMNTGSQNTVLNGGRTFAQGYWDHYDGVLRLGNSTTLGYAAGQGPVANSYVDFYQMDNVFFTNRGAGAWQNNATNFGVHNASVSTWLQQGAAAQIAALKAAWPGALVMCNADFFLNTNTLGVNISPAALDPSIKGVMDMVYCQVAIGPNGLEQFSATTAAMMQNLINAEALMSPSGTLIFEQSGASSSAWSNTSSQASWTAADWRAARFGMACCSMRNWHYNLSFSTNAYGPNNIAFMDEFGPQNGCRSWLANPVDGPQGAARTNGVWWRRFQNGVVFMNPSNNTAQTINLASLGFSHLSAIKNIGFGDATINTGTSVGSITLQPRDGRFLIGTG